MPDTMIDASVPSSVPPLDEDLRGIADRTASEARTFLDTVTEVSAGTAPDAAFPLLLLALADLSAAGAILGAIVDVVPAERFEPDDGPDPDVDPLRVALANVLDGVDEYVEVADPVLDVEPSSASVSADIALVAAALGHGLAHYDAGHVSEALWWWQYSYLQDWGDRAASALRVVVALLAHLRLDVPDDVAAEAEYDALHGA
ncbi:MAG TPA: DUF5063 domain-containing protein [Micrococcales bacterium]|uniref:DUF5063 domain-containing protein n=1 Tax=Miniimonas TaxID=947525 RepID=UPI000D528A5B|nr:MULTISPECIES: DUF5063 domain-containing protein [Miniimonas]HCX85121.1 DUF5063 domain-containing protein [Micrococcales bacterium]